MKINAAFSVASVLALTPQTAVASKACPNPPPNPANSIGIVVARFNAPLDPWVPVASLTYMYDDGPLTQANDSTPHSSFKAYINTTNTGREGHIYLQHITSHWHDLEDIMIFSQCNPFDLLSPVVNTTEQMVEIAKTVQPDEIEPFNPALWHDTADWAKINWTDPSESLWMTAKQLQTLKFMPYTPAEFWQITQGEDHPPAIRSNHGAIYAVRRETIRSRPKAVYERALAEFAKANAINPEQGFLWERFWAPTYSKKYWLPKVENP